MFRRSPIKSCTNKKFYQTREEAEDIINIIEEHDEDADLKVYRCSFCQGFHLTSAER